jgi:hypothetical protein
LSLNSNVRGESFIWENAGSTTRDRGGQIRNGTICYIVTAAHRYTIDKLLAACDGQLPVQILPITYGELYTGLQLPRGTMIFTDLERLAPGERRWAARVWDSLSQPDLTARLINHPIQAMRRYELLRELFERGINDFNVYRLNDARRVRRYPVFIRREDNHGGSETPLLHSPAELQAAEYTLATQGKARDLRMIVEFHAAADECGYYRVYRVQRIGDMIIPMSIAVSKNWVVKRTDIELDDDLVAREREYLTTNPHREFVRGIFDIAGIGYGCMDYAMVGSRPQVYEINTNPTLCYPNMIPRQARHFPDLPSSVDKLVAGFAALNGPFADIGATARHSRQG